MTFIEKEACFITEHQKIFENIYLKNNLAVGTEEDRVTSFLLLLFFFFLLNGWGDERWEDLKLKISTEKLQMTAKGKFHLLYNKER